MGRKRSNIFLTVFETMPIDYAATRAAVEKRLEEVRQYRQVGFIRQEAGITVNYEPRYHGTTNAIGKPAEQTAIRNVDREAELIRKSELLDKAMNGLTKTQREVIERSYLDDEGEYDFISCGEMGVSDRTYRRIKADAIRILAVAMMLEVYEENDGREVRGSQCQGKREVVVVNHL
ncbi:ArpU family phage transcriptional regulator [Fontibacillus phaseoli]|uniref:ArpU family phage transcriptional regulator n=1 Tax=Fontibacillus phaseoli TaxID=1416533 RepID=A0A369BPQ4_9BACL|nr:ArpU family phage packaging/lysis transcriptional regulator [Fontibacillus phaseoli]RCX22586.1 ArpU family phage transcriptional regulator [Fontibacillus phaseoli]